MKNWINACGIAVCVFYALTEIKARADSPPLEDKAIQSLAPEGALLQYNLASLFEAEREIIQQSPTGLFGPSSKEIFEKQKELRPYMRRLLVDWMMEVASDFSLSREILWQSVRYVDHFLSSREVKREELQLLGSVALCIAMQDTDFKFLKKVPTLTAGTYSVGEAFDLYKRVLRIVGNKKYLRPEDFLDHFLKPFEGPNYLKFRSHGQFFLDISVLSEDYVGLPPSEVAAVALYYARVMVNAEPFWDESLEDLTHYSESHLKSLVYGVKKVLRSSHLGYLPLFAPSRMSPQDFITKLIVTIELIEFNKYKEDVDQNNLERLFEWENQERKQSKPGHLILNSEQLFAKHKDVTPQLRQALVSWMVDLAQRNRLPQDLLQLAVSLVDRELSLKEINRKDLLILGIVAFELSSKRLDDTSKKGWFLNHAPKLSQGTISIAEAKQMERSLLRDLDYSLDAPIAIDFLESFHRVSGRLNHQSNETSLKKWADYFLKASVMEEAFLGLTPSLVAAAALYFAKTMENEKWNEDLTRITHYSQSQLEPVANLIFYLKDSLNLGQLDLGFILSEYERKSHSKP